MRLTCISLHVQLSPQEQAAVLSAFSHPDQTQANGIRLCGQKFFTIQTGPRSVYGKKAVCYAPYLHCWILRFLDCMNDLQGDGCLLVKTKLAVLVAEYVAPTQAGEATKIVEDLADYLINANF